VLLGGGLALWLHVRRRTRNSPRALETAPPLSADEQARLERLMAEGSDRTA
jgi:cytochrome c-type biogenesis protein CcmH